MPIYTATISRRVVYQRHNERVELRAADDAEANRKIRDMDRPLGVVSISVVPDRDEPATADRVERQWVANDDHITLQAFRSDLAWISQTRTYQGGEPGRHLHFSGTQDLVCW
jgi:hypothetical protein